MRSFEDLPAVRERVPLLVGVYGASGTGKTFSALRLAEGMRRVVGGDIHVIDTEARRALHYADRFTFRHVDFRPPFSPDDYAAALAHCAKKGARTIVVDNMSHEHEGQGGVLEWHEAETARLCRGDDSKRERVKMLAWQAPKASRRKLINTMLQLGINGVFCFRAKEKLKMVRGRDPEPLGWMPIAGEEFIYEMTATALLLPGANGIPTWNPANEGERAMVKRPAQFHELLSQFDGKQLCEDIGEQMARWAEGDNGPAVKAHRDALDAADANTLLAVWSVISAARASMSRADFVALAAHKDQRKAALGLA